jgi:pyruvate,orthophosphate dikinase
MRWADGARRMRVLANADTPDAIAAAIAAGAEGIGLVRSENMFLDHLPALHAVLLGSGNPDALEHLQTDAYAARIAAAQGRSITFRLLDASFYELLPHDRAGVTALATALGRTVEDIAARVDLERSIEPAMSLRASRLALAQPAIERAQIRALAAAHRSINPAQPLRILVPMLISGPEAAAVAARIREHAPDALVGAMIETPRAALDAAAIARAVDFFAWGSNDLTQYATGLARGLDDRSTLDLEGVGALIHVAETLARAAKPAIVTGVCGNLAADPRSIRAFHALGLDYISVPPAQLPRARLAAAQI